MGLILERLLDLARGVCPGAGELTRLLGPTDGRLPLAPRGDVFTFEEAKSLQPEKQRGHL